MNAHPATRTTSRRWIDRLRSFLALFLSIAGVLALVLQVAAWSSGKLGIVVQGPPARIDNLEFAMKDLRDSTASVHAHLDTANAVQDRRLATVEIREDQMMALLCVNTKPRDLALTRIPCDQYVGRWRVQGREP